MFQMMKRDWIITALIFVTVNKCGARPSSAYCELGGKRYSVGDTWHQQVGDAPSHPCVNCTCLDGGHINCTGVTCPSPDCSEPRHIRGQCCPTCDVGVEDGGNSERNLPGCDVNGEHYEHGERFPSNNTAFKPTNNQQCVLCDCFKGKVYCYLKTCLPNPRCRRIVAVDDDCCMHCAETAINKDRLQSIPSEHLNHSLEGDCVSEGRRKNGSTWKPVVGEYGEIKCVTCTCLDGRVDCRRLTCPADSALTCKHPRPRQDGCCKECPERERQKNPKRKNKKGKKRKRCKNSKKNDQTGKKKCKRKDRKRKHKKKKTKKPKTKNPFPANTKFVDIIHKLCIPPAVDRLLYHIKGDKFESIVFDNPKEKSLEHMRWEIKKGRIYNQDKTWVLDQADILSIRRNVTYQDFIGGVKKREIKRFLKRLTNRKKRCKRACRRKLIDRAVTKIRTVEFDLTKSC